MSLRSHLTKKQQEKNASWNIIELDYALSWVLAAIGEYPSAKESLIFKGGTCLKKCYFGEAYRFSEDLDFTTDSEIDDGFLDQCVQKIIDTANRLSTNQGEAVLFSWELYEEKMPHPFNQRAYTLRAQFPWHRTPLTKIKIEISRDEKLVFPTQEKNIIHEYGESFSQKIRTYSLEEILAEKYRGILQNLERLKAKGWVRSRVRDFYDVWRILKDFRNNIKLGGFREAFIQKCEIKNIEFNDSQQFFMNSDYLGRIKRDWDQYLSNLIIRLPSFEEIIKELPLLTAQVFDEREVCVT